MSYEPLSAKTFKDLYEAKNRMGVRQLVAKFHTDNYQVFDRFVMDTKDKAYIKWFLLSSPSMITDVIKGAISFYNYEMIKQLIRYGYNFKAYAHLSNGNLTFLHIMEGKTPV